MSIEKAQHIVDQFIDVVSAKPLDDIDSLLSCLLLSKEALINLKGLPKTSIFNTIEQEVLYFKKIKPRVGGYLFYFKKLYEFQKVTQFSNAKTEKDQVQLLIKEAESFVKSKATFLDLIHTSSISQDSFYFTRIRPSDVVHHISLEVDYDNTSRGCLDIAKYYGYMLLNDHFKQQWYYDEYPGPSVPAKFDSLQWQGSQVELIELLVALHKEGIFNAPFTEICTFFSKSFNIRLNNPHRITTDIRKRKKDKSRFIQRLSNSIEDNLGYLKSS